MRNALICGMFSMLLLVGCGAPAPFNPALTSQTPVSGVQMAKARQAVRICSKLPDWRAVKAEFQAAGYEVVPGWQNADTGEVTRQPYVVRNEADFIASAGPTSCGLGVVGMTPDQAVSLASAWARAYGAKTNAEEGQGLSDHNAQAWRSFDDTRNVYIAAYKNWNPNIPNTPARRHIMSRPGASISLRIVAK